MTTSIIAFAIGAALGGVVWHLGYKLGYHRGHNAGYKLASDTANTTNSIMSNVFPLILIDILKNTPPFTKPAPGTEEKPSTTTNETTHA